jgi:3'(2'), 5'-bisphosphate nucleotidase
LILHVLWVFGSEWMMAKRSGERNVAVGAARMAARVCRAVQGRLVRAETLEKKDKSPVTVADFASQAIVCRAVREAFPADAIVAEEDSAELREAAQAGIRGVVVEQVGGVLGRAVDEGEVLSWIDYGQAQGAAGRFWTLDPIDGTKGFLRGEQYAVALALIEKGQVVLGVLACPNLPIEREVGALLVAERGEGAQILSLSQSGDVGREIRVSDVGDTKLARFVESVESGHSDHDQSVKIAGLLGITRAGVRMDSQAKYAAVARGDAQIYLRLPTRADYREKIWDHAAGMVIVEEAGGKVTDVAGKSLDFTCGATLAKNRGVVATNGRVHEEVIGAIGAANEE